MNSARDPSTPAFLLVLPLMLCACAGGSPPGPRAEVGPRQVRTARAERSPRRVVTEVVGTVRATRSATIAPLLGGTVAEIRVSLGSSVRAGDVLVRLSAGDVGARLDQARAAAAQAERDRNRAILLKEQGAISVAQFEASLSQWSIAHAREAEASSVAERRVLR